MIEKISEDEILLAECLSDPLSATECIFNELENLTHSWDENEFGHVRLYQLPLLNNEYLLDEDSKLSVKENFRLHEGMGNIICFGGRLTGKTFFCETVDMLVGIPWLENIEAGFSSIDLIHIKAILEEKYIPVLKNHPFFEMFLEEGGSRGIIRSPNYRIRFKNGFSIIGINMNLQSKSPGQSFFGKHLKRLYVEEASFESQEVYKKRVEAISEIGCVTRQAGMTNFTRYTPVGEQFYDISNKGWIWNLPQYANPNFDERQKTKALQRHGGEESISYRIFVKGEIIEDGISVFQMDRIRSNYLEKKIVKKYEITKENFHSFKDWLIVDRPKGVDYVHIDADVGESAATEIIINYRNGEKYLYAYNITAYGLTDREQSDVFWFLYNKLDADCIGIDVTDGLGRAIYRDLNRKIPSEKLSWVGFNEKISVGFQKNDEDQIIIDDKGKPVYQEEYVSEWSVKRLKDLLYDNIWQLPLDYKLDKQLNSVIGTQSGNRTIYGVAGAEDHLFAAARVFAISQWVKQFDVGNLEMTKKFGKKGSVG